MCQNPYNAIIATGHPNGKLKMTSIYVIIILHLNLKCLIDSLQHYKPTLQALWYIYIYLGIQKYLLNNYYL